LFTSRTIPPSTRYARCHLPLHKGGFYPARTRRKVGRHPPVSTTFSQPFGRGTSPRLHDVLPALRAWDIPPSPRRSRPTQGRAASPVSATLSHGTRPCDIPHIIHPYNTIRPLYLARPRRRHYSQNPPRNHANPTLAPPRSPLKNPRRAYIFAILY